MRTAVLASLIAATALVSVAEAQTPAAPPAAPAAQAPAPPAPPTAAPAAPAATPPADAAAPAAPAAAAEPPPSLPTSGDGATIIAVIEKICVPLVRGGNLDDIAKANAATFGLKKNRRDNTWTMPLGANKDYNITIQPPGSNKDVCRGEVHYAVGEDKPIVSAINVWSFLHQPELILQANYVAVDPDGVKRVRKSWEHFDAANSTAVNFSTWTKPDDSSLNAKYSTGELFYQERKLG
ncbi:MAG TPA: hypothetical protein VNW53_02790 [Phenylobacterium sp.]|jgi:hypothetical protein|uniref:hypothetical protein n=1 Tax=Phenylobacterium sp. TaxID=1871053 RepID=UPI002BD25B4A|nr:hypothetical protein [Phenylobacterium sp.]HXA37900.1 hypothetical protein [Phenylobacterium sp.]